VTVLVLTPVLEEVEDRENLAVGILLEVTVNGDIAPVADLFRQVSRVEDEFRLEEGVVLVGREEAGMTSFITCHVGKALGQKRVFGLDPTAQFLVEEES